jgi:hypothetical protein
MPAVSIVYVAGQLFHLKYTIIFGLPSLFAKLDGMTPPEPPICISRVSNYSDMWRYFDRGLYNFLKTQVIPTTVHSISSPTSGLRSVDPPIFLADQRCHAKG